jgi:aryl-alcohol dehydrogenase-like predicted oxidoreductase
VRRRQPPDRCQPPEIGIGDHRDLQPESPTRHAAYLPAVSTRRNIAVREAGDAGAIEAPARRGRAAEAREIHADTIGLYQFHRPDPKVPYEESVGVLRELLDQGKIRLAGISNASVEQIDIARRVLGERNLASVQNRFSPAFRASEPELRHTAKLGIAFLPWSPLGGIGNAGDLGSRHRAFAEIAQDRGVSPQRLTLAWMLALAPTVIPIPGASRPESVTDSAQGADLVLTSEEVERLNKA